MQITYFQSNFLSFMKSASCSLIALIFLMVGCGSSNESSESYIPDYEGEWTAPPVNTPTNKVPDGAICGNGDIGMVLGGTPEDQTIYFSKNDFWKAKDGYPDGGVCYIGQLHILSPEMAGAKYHVVQRISDATIHGDFSKDNGDSYQLDAWCSATENVAVIGFQAGSSPAEFTLNFVMDETMDAKVEGGAEDGMEWHVRKFDDPSLEWPTAVSACIKVLGRESPSEISLAAGEKAIIVVSFCTNHDEDDYVKGSMNLLGTVTSDSLDSLYEAHKGWWTSFWSESHVDLDDKELEKYYYGSQYLLACCSRNTAFPPGLWGTSLTMDATAGGWAGDYHTNYNYQAPWWGAYSSNHISLTEPYDTPILEYMDNGFRHAKELLNKKGVYYPVGIGPKGFCSSMFPLTREGMLNN
jgi:alpha-L-fucosidase 2